MRGTLPASLLHTAGRVWALFTRPSIVVKWRGLFRGCSGDSPRVEPIGRYPIFDAHQFQRQPVERHYCGRHTNGSDISVRWNR